MISQLFWSHHAILANKNLTFSVPKELDDNFDKYRDDYLNWLANLKHKKINNATLLEVLSLDLLSAWWMSLLVEKSQWKSPRLHDIWGTSPTSLLATYQT